MDVIFWPSLQLIAYVRVARGILYTFDLETLKRHFMSNGFGDKYVQQIEEKVSFITLPPFTTTLTHFSDTPTKHKESKPLYLPIPFQKQLVGIIMALGSEIKQWFNSHRYILHNGNLDLRNRLIWFSFGIIDRFETAQRLLQDEHMNIINRFYLACIYYLEEDVRRLWSNMLITDRIEIRIHFRFNRCIELWFGVLNRSTELNWENILRNELRNFFRRNYLGIRFYFPKLRTSEMRYQCMSLALEEHHLDVHHFDIYSCLSGINATELNAMLTRLSSQKLCILFECFLNWPLQIIFLDVINHFKRHINGYVFRGLVISILSNKLGRGWQDYLYVDLLRSLWNLLSFKYENFFIDYDEICEIINDVLGNSNILGLREYQHLAIMLRIIT